MVFLGCLMDISRVWDISRVFQNSFNGVSSNARVLNEIKRMFPWCFEECSRMF